MFVIYTQAMLASLFFSHVNLIKIACFKLKKIYVKFFFCLFVSSYSRAASFMRLLRKWPELAGHADVLLYHVY